MSGVFERGLGRAMFLFQFGQCFAQGRHHIRRFLFGDHKPLIGFFDFGCRQFQRFFKVFPAQFCCVLCSTGLFCLGARHGGFDGIVLGIGLSAAAVSLGGARFGRCFGAGFAAGLFLQTLFPAGPGGLQSAPGPVPI